VLASPLLHLFFARTTFAGEGAAAHRGGGVCGRWDQVEQQHLHPPSARRAARRRRRRRAQPCDARATGVRTTLAICTHHPPSLPPSVVCGLRLPSPHGGSAGTVYGDVKVASRAERDSGGR
jgi:hypothetical protein